MIRNIIFDLGEVLLDLDFDKSIKAFEALGFPQFQNYFDADLVTDVFRQLEVGKITPHQFCEALRQEAQITASDEKIERAWNALLAEFYTDRIAMVSGLKSNYSLYLLSNTNVIHATEFEQSFTKQFPNKTLDSLFHKTYYSHDMGLRKPDKEIFNRVLIENKLSTNETFFIDDNTLNIAAAEAMGIHSYLMPRKSTNSILDHRELWDDYISMINRK